MAVDEFVVKRGYYLEHYFKFRPHKRNNGPPNNACKRRTLCIKMRRVAFFTTKIIGKSLLSTALSLHHQCGPQTHLKKQGGE